MKLLKNPFLNLTLLLIVLALFINSFFQGEKIAYVESGKLFNEYKATDIAKKKYDDKSRLWKSNIDTLASEVQMEIRKYEKDVQKMSPKERELARKLIDIKRKQLADYQQSVQANAQQEYAKVTQSVVTKINDFLLKYGKEHNYTMILIANQSGTIAYAKDNLDITAPVLKEINQEYEKEKK